MKAIEEVDLSRLSLHLAIRSIAYVVIAGCGSLVALLIATICGLDSLSRGSLSPLIAVLWVILQVDIVLRVRRIAERARRVRSDAHALHHIEVSVGGFLILYALARPYLTDTEASAYSSVKTMFELFIAILALWHCLVLAIFRKKPGRWDFWSLTCAVIAGAFTIYHS